MNAIAATRSVWGRLSSHGGVSAMVLALVLGTFAGRYLDEAADAAYDWLRPVSRARIGEVQRVGDEVRVRVYVTRLRGECRVTGQYVSARMAVGPDQRAYAERVDKTPAGDIPVGPEVDVGWWRIWPVGGARSLVFFSYYECAGKPAGAKLFEVPV